MARPVLLNHVDHHDLRVDATTHNAAMGDAIMLALTYPAEFRTLQAHYPIVFHKGADGAFQPVALFGFRDGDNLFLRDDRWDASYIPLSVARLPFLIGHANGEAVIHVDLDHPRVGAASGEPLFLPHGGTSDYLGRVTGMLHALNEGVRATPAFVEALLRHSLLEAFVLDVTLNSGEQHRLSGFYTIHEERLQALDGTALGALQAAGQLEPIYMALASLAQLRSLIDRMNARHGAG